MPPKKDLCRKLDQCGRVSIPFHLRKKLGIKPGDTMYPTLVDGALLMKKIDTKEEPKE